MLVGIGLSFIAMRQMSVLSQRLRADRQLSLAVNDERVQYNWLQSKDLALALLAGINGLAIAVTRFAPHFVIATVLAQLNILVGITATLGLFLYLDGKE
jgi:hypothetical protein